MPRNIESVNPNRQSPPTDWQSCLSRLEELVSARRRTEAFDLINEVDELPSDTVSYLKAAKVYGTLDPINGIEILNRIILRDPACGQAYFDRAKLYQQIGERELADRQYLAAVTFDPTLSDPEFAGRLATGSRKTTAPPKHPNRRTGKWRRLWCLCR